MRRLWALPVMVAILVMVSVSGVYAQRMQDAKVIYTGDISKEDYQRILRTLEEDASKSRLSSSVRLMPTGVTAESPKEAERKMEAFRILYAGDDDYAIAYNGSEFRNVTACRCATSSENESRSYEVTYSGDTTGPKEIYVGWLNESDAAGSLATNAATWNSYRKAIAGAPKTGDETLRYVNRYVINTMAPSPDCDSEKYSSAFFSLCYDAGVPCAYVPMKLNGQRHYRNAVLSGDAYAWIDTFLEDTPVGADLLFYMNPVDSEWQQELEKYMGPKQQRTDNTQQG